MADDYSKFLESGYYKSTNIATLQEQLANYATDDAALRSQATAQYQPTYDATKQSYQNQLGELAATQGSQVRALEGQYAKSQNALDSALNKRGLGRSSLVATQGVALQNQRNQAIADLNEQYAAQTRSINSRIQQLDASYAQEIESRINELRSENQTQLTQLQLQIAELQYNAYQAYMANKKSGSSGGGGGGRSYSSTSSSSAGNASAPQNRTEDYFKGVSPATTLNNTSVSTATALNTAAIINKVASSLGGTKKVVKPVSGGKATSTRTTR